MLIFRRVAVVLYRYYILPRILFYKRNINRPNGSIHDIYERGLMIVKIV